MIKINQVKQKRVKEGRRKKGIGRGGVTAAKGRRKGFRNDEKGDHDKGKHFSNSKRGGTV